MAHAPICLLVQVVAKAPNLWNSIYRPLISDRNFLQSESHGQIWLKGVNKPELGTRQQKPTGYQRLLLCWMWAVSFDELGFAKGCNKIPNEEWLRGSASTMYWWIDALCGQKRFVWHELCRGRQFQTPKNSGSISAHWILNQMLHCCNYCRPLTRIPRL